MAEGEVGSGEVRGQEVVRGKVLWRDDLVSSEVLEDRGLICVTREREMRDQDEEGMKMSRGETHRDLLRVSLH